MNLARRIGEVLHRMWRGGTEFRFMRKAAMALSGFRSDRGPPTLRGL